MNESSPASYFDTLLQVVSNEEATLTSKYRQLRNLLEHICKVEMSFTDLQVTDLSARISFIADKFDLTYAEQQRLHSFRLTSNKLLNEPVEPTLEDFLRDAKTLSFFVRKLYKLDIPYDLYRLLPQHDATYHVMPLGIKIEQKIRVCFQYADENYLYVLPVDSLSEDFLKVRYNVEGVNDEFKGIDKLLWKHCQLNLLDVGVDDEGILTPRMLVLEPDYLLDISTLAECFRLSGAHPLNYILSRVKCIDNPRPLLLGSIANHFLDEWIYYGDKIEYRESMGKVFKKYAIELASCPDLEDEKLEKEFFMDCLKHFRNIGEIVNNTFNLEGYLIDKKDAVLEPSYVCEALGIQGRLDYMQRDMSSFIEMKSGKADEYSLRGKVVPHTNNRVQMLLYQAVLMYNMNQEKEHMRSYLLYTRYPLLYPARTSWALIRKAMHLRNQIVANEYQVQSENSLEYTEKLFGQIYAENLNTLDLTGTLWEKYLAPQIDLTRNRLLKLSANERAYFYATYNFITKELYTSKSGDMAYEGKRGAASLWNSTFVEKCEEGSILYDLEILENKADDLHKPHIVFKRSEVLDEKLCPLPNFRAGDAVVLYQRQVSEDNVTNKLIFKGNLESISDDVVIVRLRMAQQNLEVLPDDSFYAIEPDSMDTSFRNMYLGLEAFLTATPERRELIMGVRPPQFSEDYESLMLTAENDLDRIVKKAESSQDYFLLIGPPGTGKTSFALRKMVESFNSSKQTILLLAYTNQAVNEICKTLEKISNIDYIRIGSELSCEPSFRPRLIENVLEDCHNRLAVRNKIAGCNVFVSTVASLSGKPELFRLKKFDVAIIDEASQILEPQLLGILCATTPKGENGVGKFILIGDHKQLPAVVQQKEETSKITHTGLNDLQIFNLRDAFFERLYRINAPHSVDWLRTQGRMHPEVAEFTNTYFYQNQLSSIGLPHQLETKLPIDHLTLGSETEKSIIIKHRVSFIASAQEEDLESYKVNHSEAQIVASIARQVYEKYKDNFDCDYTLGIITPYRSQIALIKSHLDVCGIPELSRILVDTVERFQGSEREIIIYSFCVNTPYQLDFLSNVLIEGNCEIDRKLNVAMTRARKQLFLTGVPSLLRMNTIYCKLLDFIKNKE